MHFTSYYFVYFNKIDMLVFEGKGALLNALLGMLRWILSKVCFILFYPTSFGIHLKSIYINLIKHEIWELYSMNGIEICLNEIHNIFLFGDNGNCLRRRIFSGIYRSFKPQAKDFSLLLVRIILSSLTTIYRSLAHH